MLSAEVIIHAFLFLFLFIPLRVTMELILVATNSSFSVSSRTLRDGERLATEKIHMGDSSFG